MLEKEEIVSPNLEELKSHYRSIITLLGEDAEREGLLKTPERDRKSTRLNSSHPPESRMPSSA